MAEPMRVLVTGATGYVGARLVPALLRAGHEVRCLVRTPAKLAATPWRHRVEVVEGDVFDPGSLRRALDGCTAAYYLVHSIGGREGWRRADAEAAANFRDAAADAGVGQIVYLGGLGDDDAELSPHLSSRHEVGEILASGPVPVTELRAAVIIGSGSASFEMLRYLVDVLPAMVTPRWVQTRCQPIAIADVVRYLVGVLGQPRAHRRIFDIGGPEVVTYLDMMRAYTRLAGLRWRLVMPVPLLSPRLSSWWIGLVTPVPPAIARPLVDSLVNEVVVRRNGIDAVVPGPSMPYQEAVLEALGATQTVDAAPIVTDPAWAGGAVFTDERTVHSPAAPSELFEHILRRPRGRRLRGSRWRVETFSANRLVRLRSLTRLPGHARIEWRLEPNGNGTRVTQEATFVPRGLAGRLSWRALGPVRAVVFARMLRAVVDTAARRTGAPALRSAA